MPERYRAWLVTELTTQSPAIFAIKVSLINIVTGFVTMVLVLVLIQEDIWFMVAFPPLVAVAMLAFVALVPSVGRRHMARVAKQNGLEKEEETPGTANARFEARRETWRLQGESSSDDWSGR